MSHYLDTIQGKNYSTGSEVRYSIDHKTGLSNLNRFLLGGVTLSGFVERAICSVVDILGIDYAKLILQEPNGHFYCRMMYSESVGAIENCNNIPFSALAEGVFRRVAATSQALMPYRIDYHFAGNEQRYFLADQYEFVWLVPLSYNSREIGFLELGSEQAQDDNLYLVNSTLLVAFIAGMLSNAIFHLRSESRGSRHSDMIIKSFLSALEIRDSEGYVHNQNMAALANQLARRLGCSERESQDIYLAGLLHDIGKIGVGEQILFKPGRLDEEEWKAVKRHPELGAKIVKGLAGFDTAATLISSHHERMDGSGYPRGLKGDQIPLGARIIGVADTYSALTEGRIYKPMINAAEALGVIEKGKCNLFDTKIVDVLTHYIQEQAIIIS